MNKDIDILVLGSLNMDLVIESEKNPYPGETLRGSNFFVNPGGKGNNQAVAIGRLGGNVAFAGCVGNDGYGKQLLDNLFNNNVKTFGVKTIEGVSTGIAIINVFKGQNTILLYEGANAKCTLDNISNLEELIARAKMLLMQLEVPINTINEAIDLAEKYNTKVILNPAPAAALKDYIFQKVDTLIPNEIEAKQLLGYKAEDHISYEELVETYRGKGVKNIIITRGKEGVTYNYEGEILHEPACVVEVVDSTGAGDAFTGGLCFSLSKGASLPEAVSYATKVAAIKVTRLGAQNALPSAEEVESFSESLAEGKA
jgi:ribokinase